MDISVMTGIFFNKTLWTAAAAWFIAQTIKTLTELAKTGRVRLSTFFGLGGMPSSHSAFMMALAFSAGFREGFSSTSFAVSAAVTMVVMVDAAGIRRAAGNQAAAINKLIDSIGEGVELDKKLRELLGHTPVEVLAGALLGAAVAVAAAVSGNLL